MIAISALYLLFVWHYAENVPFEDDWNIVPLISAALHGHLTFNALWALHGENRVFLPNLVFVFIGETTHDDLRILIMLSALLFVASFGIFLAVLRDYQGRHLTPLFVLIVGTIWFNIEGWHNALWAFQLAWYLVLFLLIVMLYFLCASGWHATAFIVSLAAAMAASLSFSPRTDPLARRPRLLGVDTASRSAFMDVEKDR